MGGGQQRSEAGLVAALDREMALLGELDALSQRQGALLDAGDTEGLLALVGERQGIVDEIARIEAGLVEEKKRIGGYAEATRAAVEGKLQAIVRLAGVVSQRDAADQARLRRMKDVLAGELAGLGTGKAAMAAYGAKGGEAGPRFQDRKG